MKIYSIVLGDYQTNCYFVADERGNAAVIDPGFDPERVLQTARQLKLNIRAILLTHGHFDHVGGVRAISEITCCEVWMHEDEEELPEHLTAGKLYYTDEYIEGDTVRVGDLRFAVLHTPGHTPGSVCLRCGNALFTGDTLFAGSCGRVDLGGDNVKMMRSLKRLAALEENLTILPGHGPASTLDQERSTNPYLR